MMFLNQMFNPVVKATGNSHSSIHGFFFASEQFFLNCNAFAMSPKSSIKANDQGQGYMTMFSPGSFVSSQ